jgi:hypothetical protein
MTANGQHEPMALAERDCDRCGFRMKHLVELPDARGRGFTRVFGCYACDVVVVEQRLCAATGAGQQWLA